MALNFGAFRGPWVSDNNGNTTIGTFSSADTNPNAGSVTGATGTLNNTAVGYGALRTNEGGHNIAVGLNALSNNEGSSNVASGVIK